MRTPFPPPKSFTTIITITTLSFHPPPPPFQYSSLVPLFYGNHPSSHSAEQQSEQLPTIPFVMPAFHPLNPARTPEVTLAVFGQLNTSAAHFSQSNIPQAQQHRTPPSTVR
ncbi:hypothetical protein RYX36_020235 [Vicia faba]